MENFLEPFQRSNQQLTGFGSIPGFVLLVGKKAEKQQWSICVTVSSLCKQSPAHPKTQTPCKDGCCRSNALHSGMFSCMKIHHKFSAGEFWSKKKSPLPWLAPAALSLLDHTSFRPPSNLYQTQETDHCQAPLCINPLVLSALLLHPWQISQKLTHSHIASAYESVKWSNTHFLTC